MRIDSDVNENVEVKVPHDDIKFLNLFDGASLHYDLSVYCPSFAGWMSCSEELLNAVRYALSTQREVMIGSVKKPVEDPSPQELSTRATLIDWVAQVRLCAIVEEGKRIRVPAVAMYLSNMATGDISSLRASVRQGALRVSDCFMSS